MDMAVNQSRDNPFVGGVDDRRAPWHVDRSLGPDRSNSVSGDDDRAIPLHCCSGFALRMNDSGADNGRDRCIQCSDSRAHSRSCREGQCKAESCDTCGVSHSEVLPSPSRVGVETTPNPYGLSSFRSGRLCCGGVWNMGSPYTLGPARAAQASARDALPHLDFFDFLVRAYDALNGTLLWEDRFALAAGNDLALGITTGSGRVFASGDATNAAGILVPVIRAYDGKTGASRVCPPTAT
jgi:hypothetical protein